MAGTVTLPRRQRRGRQGPLFDCTGAAAGHGTASAIHVRPADLRSALVCLGHRLGRRQLYPWQCDDRLDRHRHHHLQLWGRIGLSAAPCDLRFAARRPVRIGDLPMGSAPGAAIRSSPAPMAGAISVRPMYRRARLVATRSPTSRSMLTEQLDPTFQPELRTAPGGRQPLRASGAWRPRGHHAVRGVADAMVPHASL